MRTKKAPWGSAVAGMMWADRRCGVGDRAFVVFHSGRLSDISPVVYLHAHGGLVMAMLERALPRMRTGDVSYSCARFVGCCHELIDGNLDLGVENLKLPMVRPAEETSAAWYAALMGEVEAGDWRDRGMFLVDVDTWRVTHAGSTTNAYGDAGDGFGMQDGFGIASVEGVVQLPAEQAGR